MADTLRKIEREKAKKARQDAARHKRAEERGRRWKRRGGRLPGATPAESGLRSA